MPLDFIPWILQCRLTFLDYQIPALCMHPCMLLKSTLHCYNTTCCNWTIIAESKHGHLSLLLQMTNDQHGDVADPWHCGLCLWHKPPKLAHSFLFCFYMYFCLYGPFNCISFHQFSQQHLLSNSALSALFLPYWSFQLYISIESTPQPLYNPLWLTGLKAPTN